MISDLLDQLAALVGIWALRRLFGADCETDVKDDFPDDPNISCASCDAKKLVEIMKDF